MAKLKTTAAIRREIAGSKFAGNKVQPWDSERKVAQLGAVGRALLETIRKEK